MDWIAQVTFLFLLAAASFFFWKNAKSILQNIRLGKPEALNDQPARRWKNVMLLAFGQKKMFRNMPVALLHLVVYLGFVIINVEVLEIVIDGLAGTHRIFAPFLSGLYPFLINSFETLAVLVIVSVVIFLVRRNVLKVKRFLNREMKGWPKSDANYILFIEIVLMSLFLIMNASDTLLQARGVGHYAAHPTGNFFFSSSLHPLLEGFSNNALIAIERSAWWLHIFGILVFLNYLPYSKHLHILLAFPNAYFMPLEPLGKMQNMPAIQNEVLYALQPELAPTDVPPPDGFGANDVAGLSWKNLLDAYTCTECGRCTAACPASSTGKLLSPRKIMMDTRDRMEELGKARREKGITKRCSKIRFCIIILPKKNFVPAPPAMPVCKSVR